MQVIKVNPVRDKEVPEFSRLRFETAERPLRDVLLRGLHPLGLARDFSSERDSRYLPEAVVRKLNEDKNEIPGLAEFEHCVDVSAPVRGYDYRPQERPVLDDLANIAINLYFVDELSYSELVEIGRKRLAEHWGHPTAKALLTRKYSAFNDQRRFLKSRFKKAKLSSRKDFEKYDLGSILKIEDFAADDKLLVDLGVPGPVNFRRWGAIEDFTTSDGFLSLVPGIRYFDMRILPPAEDEPLRNYVHYSCRLQDGRVRCIPEMNLGDHRNCRKRAQAITAALAPGGGRYCFTLEIEEIERLFEEEPDSAHCTADVRFPSLNYEGTGDAEPSPSLASIQPDVRLQRFEARYMVNAEYTNRALADALREYGEKVSGTKEELLESLVPLLARLYREAEREMARYFRRGFIRLNGQDSRGALAFEPNISNGPLKHSVVALYVIKHLRGSRILSPAWENTSYSVEDLARALVEKRVSADGVFVKVL